MDGWGPRNPFTKRIEKPVLNIGSPLIEFVYRKTPNKRPWAFAVIVGLKRTFSPSSSFLRNENRTILSRDIAKNVRKHPNMGSRVNGGAFIGGGRLLGVLRY